MNLLKLLSFFVILVISFYLISSQDLQLLADQGLFIKLILSFISGLFYTSFLTAPLSVILFLVLGGNTNIYLVALFGGLGAVLGDLLIVKFFRSVFKIFSFISHVHIFKGFKQKLVKYHLDAVGYLLGIIIVASPFPDELGLALLGISKLSYFKLALLTFILNSSGILLILYATKLL